MIFAFSSFSFDAESGDLTQNGLRVPINRQTSDLLALLLKRAGKLVTREEIRAGLWPNHEIENYDQAINNGIGRLRYIFHDDPQNPEYIERVPKRGYRLIVEVNSMELTIPAGDGAKKSSPLPDMAHLANFDASGTILDPSAYHSESTDIQGVLATIGSDVSVSSEVPGRPRGSRFSYPYIFILACISVSVVAVTIWWHFSHQRQVPSSIALGIASFEASGPGAEELSESYRLDVADALAQLPQLKLSAIHSTAHLHLGDDGLQREAAKLGLNAILFGHFILQGNQCHLLFELVNASDGTHIASFQYSGTREELTSMKGKIQQQIYIQLKLASSGRYAIRGSTQNADAYEAYLQGRYRFSQQTAAALKQAIIDYNFATTKDPLFAKAYIGLAQVYLMMTAHSIVAPSDALNSATGAANRAYQIDPSSAEVHGVLGLLSYYRDWNLPAAEAEEREAIRLDPNQAIYHQWMAILLCNEGRCNEALREVDIARACDPDWHSVRITEAWVAHRLGNDAGMVELARNHVSQSPDSSPAHDQLANALWYDGQAEAAIAEWRNMSVIDHDPERTAMEDRGLAAFRRGGIPEYAKVRLDAIRTGKGTAQHPNDFTLEEWYVAAGEPDQAIAVLQKMYARHDPLFISTVTDPTFVVGLQNSPAFRTLLAKSGVRLPAARPK